MAFRVGSTKKGPLSVPTPGRPPFVLGSRPSTLYAPRSEPRAQGNITAAPPRIAPTQGLRNYSKTSGAAQGPGFGITGLTGET